MTAYFEQWLNGLVYELFFPAELHARQLRLFEATAQLNPPALEKLSDAQKLARLQELYEQASTPNAPLPAQLATLRTLDSIKIIEGTVSAP